MGPWGFLPWMSHEPMFQTSDQSVREIQSYWSPSAGYWIWVLMEVRKNDLKCFLTFQINYLVTLEFCFAYPLLYKTPISTLWSSFSPFSFGESESLLEIFKRREDLALVFQDFPFHPSLSRGKIFLGMKTQTSLLLSQLKELFPQTS